MPRRKKSNDVLNFELAGDVLKREIVPRFATLGTFARLNGVSDTTLRQIAAGTYNKDIGPSPYLLFRYCLAATDGDIEQSQFLCARYLAALGVIPEEQDASLLARVTRLESEIHEIKLALLRAEKRKVKRNGSG